MFILAYVKTYSLQVVQGRLFGMGQSKANQWIHMLLPPLLATLRTLGDAPARSLTALAQRLGVSEADAASVIDSREEEPAPTVTPDSPPCYVNLQEKKKILPYSDISPRLRVYPCRPRPSC